MSYGMHYQKYREYQEMQKRRRDGLRWDKGSIFLLTSALSLLILAFVFYDRPITNNNQIISYLRVSHLDLPMTPQRVWSALQKARSRSAT